MTGDQIISPEAFARTYDSPYEDEDDPWVPVQQYIDLAAWIEDNPETRWTAGAELLGIPKSRASPWYHNDAKPTPLKGLETANELGWMDASWNSEIGHAFNLLVAAIYAGGTLTSAYIPNIMLKEKLDEGSVSSLKEVIRTLVGSVKIANTDDPNRATTLQPGEHASLLGRTLHSLGVPTGRKTESGYSLPEYLDSVSKTHRKAFANTYLVLRGSQYESSRKMDIREERSEEYLQALASLIEDVTGVAPTVRTGGIYIPVDAVDQFTLEITFPPG